MHVCMYVRLCTHVLYTNVRACVLYIHVCMSVLGGHVHL